MKKILLTLALGLAADKAMAVAPVWDYVQLSYIQTDADDDLGDIEPKGPMLFVSKALTDNIFLAGSYIRLSDNVAGVDVDIDQITAGLGYNYNLTNTTDVFAALSYEEIDVSARLGNNKASTDNNGYGLTAGVRAMVLPQLEAKAAIRYVDIDTDSTTTLGLAADYLFTPQLALGVNYDIAENSNLIGVNGRYNF